MVRNLLRVLLFALMFGPVAPAQEKRATPPPAPNSLSYPDSPEGLKRMVQDLLAAIQQRDDIKGDAIRECMILPQYEMWFRRVFVESDARELSARYAQEVAVWAKHLDGLFRPIAEGGKFIIETTRVHRVQPGPLKDLLSAAREPIAFYYARLQKPEDSSVVSLGYYVYEGSSFRFMDVPVLSGVSSIKPHRIPASSGTQPISIHRVTPANPPEKKQNSPTPPKKLQGEVTLHIVVAANGTVREIQYASGPRELLVSAKEAVSQWRFRPTLVDGWPVEVEMLVGVNFHPLH